MSFGRLSKDYKVMSGPEWCEINCVTQCGPHSSTGSLVSRELR